VPRISVKVPEFSFCEASTASNFTPWHIRKLSRAGKKLQGGADSAALCGREVDWDLKTEINQHQLQNACVKCYRVYQEQCP
jgi:hypothetical protein